jgi:hypothetical protein
METVNLHGGIVVTGASKEMAATLKGREAFILSYCKSKEWSPDDLEITQIMEIRSQEGWKSPAKG